MTTSLNHETPEVCLTCTHEELGLRNYRRFHLRRYRAIFRFTRFRLEPQLAMSFLQAQTNPASRMADHQDENMNSRWLFLIGERDVSKRAHTGIEASIAKFQRDAGQSLEYSWIPTATITPDSVERLLGAATAIWCTPGSPYENTAGALAAIRFARERKLPFLGTCGGFQHALMEFAADVLGYKAIHQELEPGAELPLIERLSCSLVEAKDNVYSCDPEYTEILEAISSIEEFHCSYGLGSDSEALFAGSKLRFIARDEAGQVRAFKLQDHPFYMGTLFQPERRALSGNVHPIVRAFLKHNIGK